MTSRRWWLVGAAAALALLIAGVWFWVASTRSSTPEEAALAYLHALESGDPERVAATGAAVPEPALEAFAAATALIQDAEVTHRADGGPPASASVDIGFHLEGEEHMARLTLESVDGRWVVDESGLGTVAADSAIGTHVAVGTASAAVGDALPLVPAAYAVGAAPTGLLAGESTVRVLPGENVAATVDARLRPEATTAAQEQLDAHLATCTEPADTAPAGCGIRIPWGTEFREVSEIRYRIERSPTVTLTPTAFVADGGILVATITGTGQDGSPRTTTYRTDSWSVRGDVAFSADGIELSVW